MLINKKKRLLKKLKKYIKKEFKIEIDIKEDDIIWKLSEEIVMKSENCSKEDAYKKWILRPNLHLPGWVAMYIIQDFGSRNINSRNTVKEMINEIL